MKSLIFILSFFVSSTLFAGDITYFSFYGLEKPNYFQFEVSHSLIMNKNSKNVYALGVDAISGKSSSEIGLQFSKFIGEYVFVSLNPLIGYKYNNSWIDSNENKYYGLMLKLHALNIHGGGTIQIGFKNIKETQFVLGFSLGIGIKRE